MKTEEKSKKLKGEGDVQRVIRTRKRKLCEYCEKQAEYKHSFLLEGMRNNPASSAYCKDDCSWCEDAAIFTCFTCKPETPGGHVEASRFECGERFSHMFLWWEETSQILNPLWTGNEPLDALRSKAAASSTGCITVSIEELNSILPNG